MLKYKCIFIITDNDAVVVPTDNDAVAVPPGMPLGTVSNATHTVNTKIY